MSQPAALFNAGDLVMVKESGRDVLGTITNVTGYKSEKNKIEYRYNIWWSDGFADFVDHEECHVIPWRNDYLRWCENNIF